MKFAIVAIGYNRVHGLKRLLSSIDKANYENDEVDLIVSLDKSDVNEVENYANGFVWNHGKKVVKTYPQRLGLRKHILTCGSYVHDYDAIAVFEDDIFVAPSFYSYMKQAVEFYKDDMNIAGISLYSHLWSEGVKRPFFPQKNEFDNYFLQYAQSWGQVWMPKQWDEFYAWYETHTGELENNINTPQHILKWPKSSWLKYHIKYCIENNKYFVYPYISFTTNFVDLGEHCKESSLIYQVPMDYGLNNKFKFARFGDKKGIYYDGFFERVLNFKAILKLDKDVIVDLYGQKDFEENAYLLTTRRLNYTIINSFGLQMRPHEINVIEGIEGTDIFLYDLSKSKKNTEPHRFSMSRWNYDSRVFDYRYIICVVLHILKGKIRK